MIWLPIIHPRPGADAIEVCVSGINLNHPGSVSNLIRRAEKHLAKSPKDRALVAKIVEAVRKTENRV